MTVGPPGPAPELNVAAHHIHSMAAPALDMEDLADPRVLAALRANSRECGCSRCASLCHGVPGTYDPHHILQMDAGARAALYPTLIEGFCAIGVPGGKRQVVISLRPATVNEAPGGMGPFPYRPGPCRNLLPTGCALPRAEMPTGCVTALVCPPGGREVPNSSDRTVWECDAGKAVIREFEAAKRQRDPAALTGLEIATALVDGLDGPGGASQLEQLRAAGADSSRRVKAAWQALEAGTDPFEAVERELRK